MPATEPGARRAPVSGGSSGVPGSPPTAQAPDAERPIGLRERLGRTPVLVAVLGLYAATRIWGWIVFSLVARQQGANPWTADHPSYLQFIGFWDSDWYRYIALHGYPSVLPVDPDGTVRQNPWAFYPLFPYTVRFVSRATGLDFVGAGTFVSLACGAVAALLLYRFFSAGRARAAASCGVPAADAGRGGGDRRAAGPRSAVPVSAWDQLLLPVARLDRHALWATGLVLLSPVSAVLQIPYAESMGLMLLVGTLLALLDGRWGLCAVLLVPTCLARPVGVPLAAAIGLWWALRVIDDAGLLPGRSTRAARSRQAEGPGAGPASRRPDVVDAAGPAPRMLRAMRRHAGLLVLALFACACALLWPFLAWRATGRPDAYTATETAWRGQHLAPFQPWLEQSRTYFGAVGPWVLAGLVLAFVLVMMARPVRRTLSAPIRLWCWAYTTYLLAFLFPQSSTFRMLLPLFPLAGPATALSRSRAYRGLLLAGAAAGQLVWVGWLWHFKALPGGGDFPP